MCMYVGLFARLIAGVHVFVCVCVDHVRANELKVVNVFDSNTTRSPVGENPPEHSSEAMESIWRAYRTNRTEKGRITT